MHPRQHLRVQSVNINHSCVAGAQVQELVSKSDEKWDKIIFDTAPTGGLRSTLRVCAACRYADSTAHAWACLVTRPATPQWHTSQPARVTVAGSLLLQATRCAC